MISNNMNYIYNVEYFNEIFKIKDANLPPEKLKKELEAKISQLNQELINHQVQVSSDIETLSGIKGFHSFELYTTYPGLLIGLGYPHDISEKGAVKTGLSLDYVTGAPYLPGSYLKGQIRSWFPDEKQENEIKREKTELIRSFIGEQHVQLDVSDLRDRIFVNNVVFLGGYLDSASAVAPFAMDYITPHNKGKFKNPIPINILRIKPGIRIRFCFIIPDNTDKNLTSDQIADLFKQIILFGGIGAKTNTGYGRMSETYGGL